MPVRPTFRFAPSPNGHLHLGHAYSALLNFDLARKFDGRFLLRIEDIDPARSQPRFVAGVIEDLRWLGLTWDEPLRRQSEHFADYRAVADKLAAMGLLYPCFASRAEIAAAAGPEARTDPDAAPIYPGLLRGADPERVRRAKQSGVPCALRLDMERATGRIGGPLAWRMFEPDDPWTAEARAADPAQWGDAIIARKETPASYHLSVVVDDALQGVTHVLRGQDLEAATDLHRLLQALLSLPSPLYHHHRLIDGPGGRKLSKSLGDTSLAQLRREGASPADIRGWVGVEKESDPIFGSSRDLG